MRKLFTDTGAPLEAASSPSRAVAAPLMLAPEAEAWAMRTFGARSCAAAGARGRALVAAPFQSEGSGIAIGLRPRRSFFKARAIVRWLRRRRRHGRQWIELQSLDAATLRDLGLTGGELSSVQAEATGRAPRSRRHFAEHEWMRWSR
jgi:uncharacterized protein YjiS (DUF1127 family)